MGAPFDIEGHLLSLVHHLVVACHLYLHRLQQATAASKGQEGCRFRINSSRCRQERQEDKLPLLTSNSQLMEEPIKEAPHCLSALASCRAAQARRSSSRSRSKGTAVGSRGPVWRPAGSRAAAPARFGIDGGGW